ncbi:hypothetical protein V8C34DRAFT_43134 [Trichoderma compactum]
MSTLHLHSHPTRNMQAINTGSPSSNVDKKGRRRKCPEFASTNSYQVRPSVKGYACSSVSGSKLRGILSLPVLVAAEYKISANNSANSKGVSQPTTLRRRIAHIAALVFCADHALRPRALCLLQMAFFSPRSFRKPCPGSVPRRPRFEKLSDRECRRLCGWSYERIPNSQELACQPLPCSSLSSYQCLTLFRMERCHFRRRAASSHGVAATAGLSPLRSAASMSTGPGPGESTR